MLHPCSSFACLPWSLIGSPAAQADLDQPRFSGRGSDRRRPDEPLIDGVPDPAQNVTIEDTLEEEFMQAELEPLQKTSRCGLILSCLSKPSVALVDHSACAEGGTALSQWWFALLDLCCESGY